MATLCIFSCFAGYLSRRTCCGPDSENLCSAGETSYFSYGTARDKTISLCGTLPSRQSEYFPNPLTL